MVSSIMSLTPLLVAQAEAGEAAADSSMAVNSVWDFVMKGGVMMVPIGLCSLLVLAIAIERLLVLRRSRIIPPRFVAELKEKLGDDATHRDDAIRFCEQDGSSIARVMAAGIRKLGGSTEQIEKSIMAAGEDEVFTLRRRLRVLAVIASIAPLLGLVGTIFGMIKAFQTVATSGDALGRTELLAGGIYEALITTAAGLVVAIPALIFYHWISARIDGLVREMDRLSIEFVESNGGGADPVSHPASTPSKPEPASPTIPVHDGRHVAVAVGAGADSA